MVHHDLWDYDATSAPQLVAARHGGKMVDAVAQASKQGFLYVFDRVTGEPLWPIEERPVPKSDVPGEHASATQPFPTAPPPFARQVFTPDDIDPYFLNAAERASWKDRVASASTGLFTPPSLDHETIALPGARGGSNWGTTAANPQKGIVYVFTQDWPSAFKLAVEQPPPPAESRGPGNVPGQQGRGVYERNCQVCHGPDRGGAGPVPSLAGLNARLRPEDFRQIVAAGKGEMPAFPNIDNTSVSEMFAWLANPNDAAQPGRGPAAPAANGGPVVASGGAPGGLE